MYLKEINYYHQAQLLATVSVWMLNTQQLKIQHKKNAMYPNCVKNGALDISTK
ncbi:hypothetical protein JCM19053_1282 [Vibrio sp. JCM 19053]|nr:hypothetical protein JCM19053_1282 [Vibrio sp. JCM 19053]